MFKEKNREGLPISNMKLRIEEKKNRKELSIVSN